MIKLKDKISALLIVATTLQLNAGIREDVHNISKDKKLLDKIIQNTSYTNNVISTACNELCQTMMADHEYWPPSKISYFDKGKKNIDLTILAFPIDRELHNIRLLVQLNTLALPRYNKEVTQDFNTFRSALPFIEADNQGQLKFIVNLLENQNHKSLTKGIINHT